MLSGIIMCTVLALLAIIGLGAVMQEISRLIFCSGIRSKQCLLILLSGNDADMKLRASINRIACDNGYYPDREIYALDLGLSDNMYEMCRVICEDAGIKLYEKREFLTAVEEFADENK